MSSLDHLVRSTLPPQIRHSRIRLSWFHVARNYPHFGVKPPPGTGLWTSTYNPSLAKDGNQVCSEWLDFVVSEMPQRVWRFGYIYDVARDLKILEISSHEDLMQVNDVYGYEDEISIELAGKYPGHGVHRWPDWGKLARDFDAVHLTSAGQWDTRMPYKPEVKYGNDNLYGWDCESTLWLRLYRRSLRFSRKIRFNYHRWKRQELRDAHACMMLSLARMRLDMEKWSLAHKPEIAVPGERLLLPAGPV